MSWIGKYKQLPPARRRLLIDSARSLVLVRVWLRLFPYERVNMMVEQRAATHRARMDTPAITGDDVAWAIGSAAVRIPGTTCLPRALAGRYLLLRAGLPAEIRFGVTKNGGGFAAHAWLESGGRILIGGETAADYSPMPAWPADAA